MKRSQSSVVAGGTAWMIHPNASACVRFLIRWLAQLLDDLALIVSVFLSDVPCLLTSAWSAFHHGAAMQVWVAVDPVT